MGYYLPKNKIPKGKRWLIVSVVTTMLMLVLRMLGISFSYGINNIFIVLYSILIFNIAVESAFLEKISKNIFVKEIARYSFGIYILHPVFLNVLNKGLHIYPDILPAIAGEALFFIIALGGGYLLTKCLCGFSLFRKILL